MTPEGDVRPQSAASSPATKTAQAGAQAKRRTLRCAFVHAPDPGYAETQNYGAVFMPVWAYTLAAHVADDGRFELALHDVRFEKLSDVAEADVFLFSGINQDAANMERVRAALEKRYPDAVSFVGGPIAWSFDQAGTLDRLAGYDHVCIGDGELLIAEILEAVFLGRPLPRVIRARERFPLARARPLLRPMVEATLGRYYGAVLEVSRGCPFLCEFCDIRVMEDNNRPHNKPAELVVSELDMLCRLGVRQVLLACDNFIGDPRWAGVVLDEILEWQARTGFRPALYTWLTINLYKHTELMRKMRRAGFDMLFIGIESFDSNSLLETAKVQNTAPDLVAAVREIQSFGFIVVAGLIFGFDSDSERSFEKTLNGLAASALLSGDPSLLTALPGTPLYRRMKLAGRLRDVHFGLGGYKYQTNIRYLMARRQVIDGYKRFVRGFCEGSYQFARLKGYFELLERGNFIPLEGRGFGNLALFARMLLRNPAALRQMARRLARFCAKPGNIYHAARGLGLTLSRRRIPGRFGYFQFWLFAWTNAVLKYQNIGEDDFDVESVGDDFDPRRILPDGYAETANEPIPKAKVAAQLRATTARLRAVIDERSADSAARG